uniref:Uncharacterized protein n=1 Tax=Arundo donax TaxID=35708 RepID=A0A0A8Z0R3_ARUDO
MCPYRCLSRRHGPPPAQPIIDTNILDHHHVDNAVLL